MPLARELAYALDAVLMARAIGIEPDAWQAEVLRSDASRTLLNCCRQSGKSSTAGIVATHTALYQPGSLSILLSPSLRQSQELFRKCLDVYRALDRPVPAESENRLSLELENGSRIVSLPGKEATVRGFSGVALLLIDEAARVPDELYRSVRPMLAVSHGRLIALSTPFGKRGWWFEEWENGGDRWQRVKITADHCPRISADFLDEERRSLGALFYRSEYECQFVDTIDAVFSSADVLAALTPNVTPLFGSAA